MAALAATVSLAAVPSAYAASAAPAWSPAIPYERSTTTATVLASVFCFSAGNCIAVGVTETFAVGPSPGEPVVAVERGGGWGAASQVSLPPGDSGSLLSVSCTSAASCVAIGALENSTGVTEPVVASITVSGSTATATAAPVTPPSSPPHSLQLATLTGVSCTSGSGCTAVGSYIDSSGTTQPMIAVPGAGPTWDVTKASSGLTTGSANSTLTAVACPGGGACEAVGNYEDSGGDAEPWAAQLSGGTILSDQSVSLPSDFDAAAGKWSSQPGEGFGIGADGLDAIACPSAGACTAGGSYTTSSGPVPVAVPIDGGTPGTAVELTDPSPAPASAVLSPLTAIWCSDALDCAVGGTEFASATTVIPATASEIDGAWSPFAPLTVKPGDLSAILGMTCTSAEVCVATGREGSVGSVSAAALSGFFAYSAPAVSVTTTSLPGATVGAPYAATLQATGGTGHDSWSISTGSLPAGLSLDAATGVISGTPTAAGQDGFAATVSDAGPPSQTAGSAGLSITVAPAPAPRAVLASISIIRVRTAGDRVTVVLACAGALCAGRLRVTGVEHFRGRSATAVDARASRRKNRHRRSLTRTITLAGATYALAAGRTQTLTLTLSRTATGLLTELHRLSGLLTATPIGARRPAASREVTFSYRSRHHRK